MSHPDNKTIIPLGFVPVQFPYFEGFGPYNAWGNSPYDQSLLIDPYASNYPSYVIGFTSPPIIEKDPTEEDLNAEYADLNDIYNVELLLGTYRPKSLDPNNGRSSIVFNPVGKNNCDHTKCCNCGSVLGLIKMFAVFIDSQDESKQFPDSAKMEFSDFTNSFKAGIGLTKRTFCEDCVKCYEFVISNPTEHFSIRTCEKFVSRCKEISAKTFTLINLTFSSETEKQIVDVLVMYEIFNTRNQTVSFTQYRPRETSTHIKINRTFGKQLIAYQDTTGKEQFIIKWVPLV